MDKKTLDKIFKANDIRGLSPQELSPEIAYAVGRALGDFLPKGTVAVGRDMREDSLELAEALMAGLLQQGRKIIDLGLICSDMMYYAVGEQKLAGGAMVTASHNPGRYDGIKITSQGVVPVGIDSGLLKIEKSLKTKAFAKTCEEGCATGEITKLDITQAWVKHCIKVVGTISQPLKIGIDFGNGMAAIVLDELKKKTDLTIEPLFTALDGTFPNHVANPLEPKNLKSLQKLVVSKGLDCGIAFDGDGDRAFFVDELGQPISASVLGAILARDMLEKNPGETMLYNAIVSDIVPATIESFGGKSIRTKVGHSYIKADMRVHKALFACEHSGHFYFKDNYSADSGLIAALMTLKVLSEYEGSMSELTAPFQTYFANMQEQNFTVRHADNIIARLKKHYGEYELDTLDGLTVRSHNWWLNVRRSNTEPYLRLNIEADDATTLKQTYQNTKRLIKRFDK